MWTIPYKGQYIHGYTHTDRVQVLMTVPYHQMYQPFKSVRAAKCFITKQLRKSA